MKAPEPLDNTDPQLVTNYEDTTYKATIRRTLSITDSQGRGLAPVRLAPGEDGLRGVVGFLSSSLGCSTEDAEGLAENIALAWLDARATKMDVATGTETGPREGL